MNESSARKAYRVVTKVDSKAPLPFVAYWGGCVGTESRPTTQ